MLPSTIWLVCAWSAVTMTRVWPSFLAKASAAWTASSSCSVSPIWPHGSAAWSFLSIEALSTWRKKPFFWPLLFFVSRSIDFVVIDFRSGTGLKVGSGWQVAAGRLAPPDVASSGANFTGMLPGENRPRSGFFWSA